MSLNGRAMAAAAAILLAVGPTRSEAQADPPRSDELPGAIIVQVSDTSLNPLPAAVVIRELRIDLRLPPEGRVLFVSVPDGSYTVEVRHDGHAPLSTVLRVSGDTVRAEFALSRLDGDAAKPATSAAVGPPGRGGIAAARLRAFIEQTLTMTSAVFLTRKEIERRRPRAVSDLLRHVRAVKVERGPQGRTIARSTDAPGPTCGDGMLVLVDGAPLVVAARSDADAGDDRRVRGERSRHAQWLLTAASAPDDEAPALRWVGPGGDDLVRVARHAATPTDPVAAREPRVTDIDRLRVESIVAIEIYTTPWSSPSEFRAVDRGCGLLLIWTVNA